MGAPLPYGGAPPPPPPLPPATPAPQVSPVTIVLSIVTLVAVLAAAVGWFEAFSAERDVDDLKNEVEELRTELHRLEQDFGVVSDDTDTDTDTESLGVEDLLDELGGEDLGGLADMLGTAGGAGSLFECFDDLDFAALLGGESTVDIPHDSLDAQFRAVAKWVEQHRGLGFESVPNPTYVSPEEMTDRIRDQIVTSYPADVARADQEMLIALGVLPPGTDLLEEYTEFAGSSVAGYFDPDTGELAVLADEDEPFDILELTTVAHELEHAVAHQALTLPIADDTNLSPDDDGQRAALALVEGDATLTMTQFQLAAATLDDLIDTLGTSALDSQISALADAPTYFAQQQLFPYFEGEAFVCALYGEGGWDAVDDAYKNPPTTTAQVMFPQRYLDSEGAIDAPNPEAPGDDWTEVRRTTFGAADLMFLFDAIGIGDARTHASAWAGGEIGQWRNGEDIALRLSLVERATSSGLCQPLRNWANTLDDGTVECDGVNVLVTINA
ncbi:MAG: hypothetical protein ACT4OX_00875 [Actinomycetota bacterium]